METDVDYRSTASPNNDVPSFEELWNADPNTQTPNASQQHQEAGQAATDDFDDDCDDEDIEALLETPEHKLNNNRWLLHQLIILMIFISGYERIFACSPRKSPSEAGRSRVQADDKQWRYLRFWHWVISKIIPRLVI
jgi:hypothetical protein